MYELIQYCNCEKIKKRMRGRAKKSSLKQKAKRNKREKRIERRTMAS